MTPTRTRIGTIGVVYGAALAIVVCHLWLVMVGDHETWARRSHENRYSFKSVPGQRGTLHDRFGRVLVQDEPSTELAVHYLRFRLRHPVGAAVHGATALARLLPERGGTAYHYGDGALGVEAAAADLLAMPAALLAPRALEKDEQRELAGAVTTVLAGCSGLARRVVYTAVRQAAAAGDGRAVGDVLPIARSELLLAFTRRWRALQELDRSAWALQQAARDEAVSAEDEPGLLATLERLRPASLGRERVTWMADGTQQQGILVEEVRRVFARRMPFDFAAMLRVEVEQYAGIEVIPSVARRSFVPKGSALEVLLGTVVGVDRSLPGAPAPASVPGARPADAADATPPEPAAGQPSAPTAEQQAQAEARRAAIQRLANRELPEDWLQELEAPAEDPEVEPDADVELRAEARRFYLRALLTRERRGLTGIERAFDEALMGQLGVRLVEHDAKSREQLLWSDLRVEAGADVALTFDLDLQRLAEQVAATARAAHLHGDARDQMKTEAALALIDVRSGDVLAYAGAPIVSPSPRDVPGIVWFSSPDLGSLVKPFVLVEQLQSELAGRPHVPLAALEPCQGALVHQGERYMCDGAHWGEGTDAVAALAKSCNCFFYQLALGMHDDGLVRALRRFGLCAPGAADDPFASCWQPEIRGIPVARPVRTIAGVALPHRAIGYGVGATPLHVARAYAAFATGWLPTLGVSREARPRVVLHDVAAEMARAELGLRECLQSGTGKQLHGLAALGACGKTGTAAVHEDGHNNAWFAGYLPPLGRAGVQLGFCAVVYWVRDKTHGADAAGQMLEDLVAGLQADAELYGRYLAPEGGR